LFPSERDRSLSPDPPTLEQIPLPRTSTRRLHNPPKEYSSRVTSRYSKATEVPLLQSFHKWLKSLEVNKDEKSATQHVNQIYTIWRNCDRSMSIDSMLDVVKIRNGWLEPSRSILLPGTIKSYIGSINLFTTFILGAGIPGISLKNVPLLQAITRRWSQSLGRIQRCRTIQLRVEDSEERITKEEIKAFANSSLCNLAKRYIADFNEGEPITCQKYVLFRNFLIMMILVSNAQL